MKNFLYMFICEVEVDIYNIQINYFKTYIS